MSDDLDLMPVVLGQGRYRMFRKPDGSIRINFRDDSVDPDADDAVIEVPGFIVKLAEGGASPLQMIKAMRGVKFG